MNAHHVFSTAIALSLAAIAGCSAETDASSSEADNTAAKEVKVDGERAERLVNVFDALGVGTAGAGSRFAAVEKLACERNDQGSMSCHFFAPGFSPPKKEIADTRGKAEALFAAIAALDGGGTPKGPFLVESGMGKSWIVLPKIDCPEARKCVLTTDRPESATQPFTIAGDKAATLRGALGAFGATTVLSVSCVMHSNGALDSRAPMTQLPTYACDLDAGGKPQSVDDAEHTAEALHASLRALGLPGSDDGVKATRVRCKKNDATAECYYVK